jgi:hypothetical protein
MRCRTVVPLKGLLKMRGILTTDILIAIYQEKWDGVTAVPFTPHSLEGTLLPAINSSRRGGYPVTIAVRINYGRLLQ